MPNYNLPPQLTPFIGRADEIDAISVLLDDPSCLLLTLVGPGGIGKTRLAIEVAGRNEGAFVDGVFFVDLQPVSTTDYLVPAITDALDIALFGEDELHAQLLRYLEDKQMLLIVDNFEHLLEGVGLLVAIIEAFRLANL